MKFPFVLLFAFTSAVTQPDENVLQSLVFDFSSEFKSTLPSHGWLNMNFSVVHYNERRLQVSFKATCVESGIDLAYYPNQPRFQLNAGEELPITMFMNDECGNLKNLDPGEHNRTIRFQFIDIERKDTLAFEQQYVIEIPGRN